MASKFDLSFLDRTLKTTGLLILLGLPFGLYYVGYYPTLAAFSGAVWSVINMIFISALIRSSLRPDGADKVRAASLGLIKFPMLYSAGYFLLKVELFEPTWLLVGFSSVFVVLVLKAGGRMVMSLDEDKTENKLNKAL